MADRLADLIKKAFDFYYKFDYSVARGLFTRIISQDPQSFSCLAALAKIELAADNPQKAIALYRESLAAQENQPDTLNDLGNLLLNQNQTDQAINYFKKALEYNPQYYWAAYNIGYAYQQFYAADKGRQELSRVWLEKALAIKADYYPALNRLGLYYLDQGNLDEAEKIFLKTCQVNPRYKYSFYNLGSVYRKKGEIDQAKQSLVKAIQCAPNYTAAFNDLGIIFQDCGDYTTALYYYCRALQIDSSYKYALYNAGLVFAEVEEYQKAYAIQQRVLKLSADYTPAQEERERLEKEFANRIKEGRGLEERDLLPATYEKESNLVRETAAVISPPQESTSGSFLEKFGRNISRLAQDGKLYEVLGRDNEICSLLEVLFKIKKNNPLLVGKAGVGKTAIVEGLALKITRGEVPAVFKNQEIVEINMGMVVASTKYRGEFETRLLKIVEELKNHPDIILFIDEIHTVVGAGQVEGGNMDAADILKPALARGELRCIGATTTEEYTRYFQTDKALERRFYKIDVGELDKDSTLQILKNLKGKMQDHYNLTIDETKLESIVDLAHEEVKNRCFPDKALDVLEKVCSRCALDGKKAISETEIKNIVGEFVGIKFIETSADQGRQLLDMERFLKERVYGQDQVIDKVCRIIRLAKQRLDLKPYQPDGIFFFGGSTGVGKTYLAKQIALFLFGSEAKLFTINMNEYSERHSVSKLLGSPPGYVGHDEIPLLSATVGQNPSCLLLLDEVDKADREVLKVFTQIFDEGRITDSKGNVIFFADTTIIMTSNTVGNAAGGPGFKTGAEEPQADLGLAAFFPPEFVNRIDEVLIFGHIERPVAKNILQNIIMQQAIRNFAQRGINLNFDMTFVDLMLERGYSRDFGVCNLERVFTREVMTHLATELYRNPQARALRVSAENGEVFIQDTGEERGG